MYLANTSQIRAADRIQIEERDYPGLLLMESAARLATERLLSLYPDQAYYLVLAGPGNNGGDGLVMARLLYLAGREVKVLLSHEPDRYQGDALINYRILRHLPLRVEVYSPSLAKEYIRHDPLIVDALLGTGISASLRDPIAGILAFFAKLDFPVVAVDLPSGLSADTGACINEVLPARHTFTFQLPKICHAVSPASGYCGQVHVLDIGIWPEVISQLAIRRELLEPSFVSKHYQERQVDSHKGSFGHLLLVGGSQAMTGAISLSTLGALNSGVGLLSTFSPEACQEALNHHSPEAMTFSPSGAHLGLESLALFKEALKGKSVVAMGPGMGTHSDSGDFLEAALPLIEQVLILDADALNLLAARPHLWELLPEHTVLTPHPGEMRRLSQSDQVLTRRLEQAEELALNRKVTVILKGAGTLVCLPDGSTYVNSSGNPGMAGGGSGDVLTGVLGGLLAQQYPLEIAMPMGVYLHGLAADILAQKVGQEGVLASGIAGHISQAIQSCMKKA